MKVGIMTMHRIRNYGSYLQAYGLKRIIEDMGHQVEFVDYKIEPSIEEKWLDRKSIILKKVFRRIKNSIKKVKRIMNREEEREFDCFIRSFEREYLKDLGITKERKYRSNVDVLVIGSDEVFNCTQGDGVGFSKELFGADNNANKVISYAASFGNTTLWKLEKYNIKEEVKVLLANFSAISVRDKNSQEIIWRLIEKRPEIHLDPVLMYDFKDDIVDVVNVENYILVYAYNRRMSEEEGKAIREFAALNDKRIIAISGEQSFCDEYVYCKPLEMLSYFKHADYVITDTFHGTIFSVVNHRQFAVMVRRDETANGYGNYEKLSYLLEILGLEGRCVKKLEQLGDILEQKINYVETDRIIKEERNRTRIYLKEQISFVR